MFLVLPPICVNYLCQGVPPIHLFPVSQFLQHGQECPIKSLHLTVPLRVVGCCSGAFNTTVLLELCEQLVVNLLLLVMMQSCRETKFQHKIPEDLLSCCLS